MAGQGEVVIRIVGDSTQFERTLGNTDTFLGRFSESMGGVAKKLDEFGTKAFNTGKKMTLGLTLPIGLAAKSVFDAASDMNENVSKMGAVFGDASGQISSFAKGAAQSIGLSFSAAVEATSTFGNMFVQLGIGAEQAAEMSQQMVTLAADFASFHNADITQVIEAQSAAFRGEYDALQKFVPLINAATVEQKALEMTGKAATSELTAQEKALAVQALMMEGAGDAVGDFARTADGAANQQRILTAELQNAAAEIGNTLLPIGLRLVEWARDLVTWFSNLSEGWQTVIMVGGIFLAAMGPIIAVIGALATAIGVVATALAFLAANPIILAIAAVAALAAGVVYAYQNFETFRSIVDTAMSAVKTVVQTAVREVVGFFLDMASKIVTAADAAFGWVPGIGGKLEAAKRAVTSFRDDVNGALGGIKDKTVTLTVLQRQMLMNVPARDMNLGVMHSGGTVHTGMPTWPGLRADERPAILQVGERVIPRGQAGGHGGGINIENLVVANGRSAAEEIALMQALHGQAYG